MNVSSSANAIVDWLLSDQHWFNAEPRTVHLLSVPSWLTEYARPYATPTSKDNVSGPLKIEFLTAELWMIFAPVFFYWTYSTWLYFLSHMKWTLFEVHRIPTNQPARKPNKVTITKVMYTVALQHLVQSMTALLLVVLTRPENVAEWRMENPLVVIVKLFIASLCIDTYQYWMHRWMHVNRALYRAFHSVHHELTVPFAYGALYNHPFEGFLMDTVGGAIPSLLLNMHPWTSAIFYSVATLKTVDDHCGYAWAWSPAALFNANGAAYHDIHHWGKGRMYNFSQPFYTFWDHLMGTEYDSAMARKKLLREQQDTDDKSTDSDSSSSTSTVPPSLPQKQTVEPIPAAASPKRTVHKRVIGGAASRSAASLRVRKESVLETPSNSSDEGSSPSSRSSKRLSDKNKLK
ncbi:fatty acid hydroxylase superfamily-domain-containing protein [Obelidium mucronatum]|nr:fatty acid hydroxylase superfamily-domain-containing protein [Obelidium mucronatum]